MPTTGFFAKVRKDVSLEVLIPEIISNYLMLRIKKGTITGDEFAGRFASILKDFAGSGSRQRESKLDELRRTKEIKPWVADTLQVRVLDLATHVAISINEPALEEAEIRSLVAKEYLYQ